MKEALKNIGGWIIGIAILVGISLIAMLFIEGGVWLSNKLYPWLVGISGITLLITISVLLPNAVFSATPRFAGPGMVIASYVFGATLWFWSLLLTYVLWGGLALFIGLLMMGVGVVPIAILATLFKAEWSILGQLLLLTVLTFGIRYWGFYLLAKAEENTIVYPKADSVAVAARYAFGAASDVYDTAFRAIEVYSNRANHYCAILKARHTLYRAPVDDSHAAGVYDEAVAACTDLADFEPYTEAYLDAHTAAIDTLSAAFDNLTVAFAALNHGDDLYASAAAIYKAACDAYTFAISAYSDSAHCAVTTALEGNIQAVKDEIELGLLEIRAANAAAADAVTAKATAAAFKAKAAENATKAKLLEQKAKVAETKAEIFLAKSKSAELLSMH